MVAIKDFGMPKCCMNCEMFDGEYGNCDIMGDTQDFEYQWDENRPFDCPLVEAIPKSDYEARLRTDMLSMLYKLRSEIINMPKYFPYADHTRWFIDGDVFVGLIDNQIDALKENEK